MTIFRRWSKPSTMAPMSIWSIRRLIHRILPRINGVCRQNGGTLLMTAAANGKVEALQFLIDSKASLDLNNEATHA